METLCIGILFCADLNNKQSCIILVTKRYTYRCYKIEKIIIKIILHITCSVVKKHTNDVMKRTYTFRRCDGDIKRLKEIY